MLTQHTAHAYLHLSCLLPSLASGSHLLDPHVLVSWALSVGGAYQAADTYVAHTGCLRHTLVLSSYTTHAGLLTSYTCVIERASRRS